MCYTWRKISRKAATPYTCCAQAVTPYPLRRCVGQNREKFLLFNPFDLVEQTLAELVEESYAEDLEEISDPTQALLDMFSGKQRYTTPVYDSPELKSDYAKSAPFSAAYKVDVNKRKGIIESYLTVYNAPDGLPYVDPYNDVVERGSFSKTIAHLDADRKSRNNPHLCLYLWQHDRKEPIGGIKAFTEDRKGVVYTAQLALGVRRAQEAMELMEAKMTGSSYGYDAVVHEYKGDIRHLKEVRLHECSVVSFPANPHAHVLGVKSQFFVPSTYPGAVSGETKQWLDGLKRKIAYGEHDLTCKHESRARYMDDAIASAERLAERYRR